MLVGLGNPGLEYAATRHNVGFRLLDRLVSEKGLRWKKPLFRPWLQTCWYGSSAAVWLLEPLTFMNRSGEAVAAFLPRLDVAAERVLVVADQIDLEPGRLRLKRKGSSGGHRGLTSIERVLGPNFPRLWIGVGRPPPDIEVAEWVLSDLGPDAPAIEAALVYAAGQLAQLPDIEWDRLQEALNGFRPSPVRPA